MSSAADGGHRRLMRELVRVYFKVHMRHPEEGVWWLDVPRPQPVSVDDTPTSSYSSGETSFDEDVLLVGVLPLRVRCSLRRRMDESQTIPMFLSDLLRVYRLDAIHGQVRS